MKVIAFSGPLPFWFAVFATSTAFFLFPFFFSGRSPPGVNQTVKEVMKILQPIKIKSTGRVIGHFYRLKPNGILQYVSFASTVDAIPADKVEPATEEELEAAKDNKK